MGQFEFVASPVSAEEPCGPDLEGQGDFDSALAWIEGRFPQSYLKFSNPQKMASPSEMTELVAGFDLSAELAPLLPLMKRTRDVRLLVPAAKLSILAGDFDRFAELVSGMAALANAYWDELHPRIVEDSYAIRESHFSLLSDMPTVVMPLQEKPFINLRRVGPVSFRSYLLASKAVSPRSSETVPDESQLREALVKTDDFADIKQLHAKLALIADSLQLIRAKFIEKAGGQNTPDFDKLNNAVGPFSAFLKSIIEEREPSAPPASEADGEAEGEGQAEGGAAEGESAAGAAATVNSGAIASSSDAAAHLAAVETYFRTREPSSPATLLVRQAQRLVGKSFIEAMQVLNPKLADDAAIKIGGEIQLIVTAQQMSELAGETPTLDGIEPARDVASRTEASAVMEAVEKYYKKAEPASPIPLLLSRARTYAGKDFAALMKEIAPEEDR
jgi:type VI secretion system protein ImpA